MAVAGGLHFGAQVFAHFGGACKVEDHVDGTVDVDNIIGGFDRDAGCNTKLVYSSEFPFWRLKHCAATARLAFHSPKLNFIREIGSANFVDRTVAIGE